MSQKNMNVLVVYNFAPMRKILKIILERLGFHNIEEANDGENAYSKLQDNNCCKLVITDTRIPNLDGIGLLKKIRNNNNLRGVPVMMLIDKSEEDMLLDALFEMEHEYIRGVSYIIKPFNTKILKDKLDEILVYQVKNGISEHVCQ